MAKKSTAKKSVRKPNAAFMKPMTPSSSLAEVVGTKPIPRTEVTKKLWAYIKKNGLQDKKNKRMIKADDALKAVFGGKATAGAIARHNQCFRSKGRRRRNDPLVNREFAAILAARCVQTSLSAQKPTCHPRSGILPATSPQCSR